MKKTVIYGVLNWGLGHATRSIPIIRSLLQLNYTPIICSDGDALSLLQKEFPSLTFVDLPPYNMRYTHRNMLANVARYGLSILKTIHQEEKILQDLVEQYQPIHIISDNRYGFCHPEVKSIIITHQLKIPANSNWQSKTASNILHRYIEKFDVCWVPDAEGNPNLSGMLSHEHQLDIPVEYIGALSRFSTGTKTPMYDLAFVLSGPEPQRTCLEKIILDQLPSLDQKCILIRGTKVPLKYKHQAQGLEVFDLADSKTLEDVLQQSRLVLSRSGYTTIMDLVAMSKPAILIPTPGQPEQEFLAEHLAKQFLGFKFAKQDDLDIASMLAPFPVWVDAELDFSFNWSDDKLGEFLE